MYITPDGKAERQPSLAASDGAKGQRSAVGEGASENVAASIGERPDSPVEATRSGSKETETAEVVSSIPSAEPATMTAAGFIHEWKDGSIFKQRLRESLILGRGTLVDCCIVAEAFSAAQNAELTREIGELCVEQKAMRREVADLRAQLQQGREALRQIDAADSMEAIAEIVEDYLERVEPERMR